jgi:transcriptional regulator with XRE-family HTH domain
VHQVVRHLGKRIASLRREVGLTQEQLAEQTSYSVDFISLVERGINAPAVERLPYIAAALHVDVWELFAPEEKIRRKSGDKKKRQTS